MSFAIVNPSGPGQVPPPHRLLLALSNVAQRPLPAFLVLFIVSALLNVVVGTLYGYRSSPQVLDRDELEYYDMATNMLAGHWDFGARRTLLYPLVIAALRLIDGNFRFVSMAVSVIAALSAPLLYLLVRRLSGSPRLGLVAGVLMMSWPTQFFLATSLYSETVALPCFLLFLLLLPQGSRALRSDWPMPQRRGAAVLAGIALGMTAQIRPMYLLFLPFALAIPFLDDRHIWRAGRTALLVGVGFAVVVLPWSAWMTSRYREPVILTANGGETLAGGLNPSIAAMTQDQALRIANRETWVGPGKWLPPQMTGYLSPAEMRRLSYPQLSRLLEQRTLDWIAAHPAAAARIELCKLGYMWGFYPWRAERPIKLLAGNLPVIVLVVLALVALLRQPVRWLGLARLWTLPLFTSGVSLISWGSWRFRQPADAALLAFCVIAWGLRPGPKPLPANTSFVNRG